jgi:hypothetical protein
MIINPVFTNKELESHLEDFFRLYFSSPISDNLGGMHANHAFALYVVLKKFSPALVVESGVWKGFSTWLIESTLPNAKIVSIDPEPKTRQYTSFRAYDIEDSLCFFDDHQNAYQRLQDMKWHGFKRAIFEDNFPFGQGDCYSLRHVLSRNGHPTRQMSEQYKPKSMRRLMYLLEEKILYRNYSRQSIVRKANNADRSTMLKNISVYQEMSPICINSAHDWGGSWDDPSYSLSATPLFPSKAELLENINSLSYLRDDELSIELFYGYICYIELR